MPAPCKTRGGRLATLIVCAAALTLTAPAAELPQATTPGQPAFGGPDELGGYATTHILLRLDPALSPANLAQGGVTIDGGALDDLAAAWNAQAVSPLLSARPKNAGLARRHGLDRTYRLLVPPGTDTPKMAGQFAKLAGVELAEVDGVGGVSETIPNDPGFPQQWGMHNTGQNGGLPDADIDAPEAWCIHTGSGNVIIAVLDTGVQADHPELEGRVIPGFNTYDNNTDTSDPHGHGSHVAGIAIAKGNNNGGVAGVNWNANVLAMTVVNDFGGGSESHVADAIVWATDFGVDIISMSLQYHAGTATLQSAVNYAFDQGVLLIAASGNNLGNTVAYPAKFPNCMGVAATNRFDERASFSNFGPEVDLAAPGKSILSTTNGSGYTFMEGTSMATPHVSGLASLIRSYNNALSHTQIESILTASADDLGEPGWDEEFGWGRINAHAALLAADPRGDINCDGLFDGADIDSFFEALGDPAGYADDHPGCDPLLRGDMNGDSAFDGADIEVFFEALGGG